MRTVKVELTQGEISALLDAASHMSDDFLDYYSFLGPKRAQKHCDNYSSAMDKLRMKRRRK